MNRKEFLIQARKIIRAKYTHYKDAAKDMGMSPAHLCNVLNDNVEKLPQSLLDVVGYQECQTEYKRVKKS